LEREKRHNAVRDDTALNKTSENNQASLSNSQLHPKWKKARRASAEGSKVRIMLLCFIFILSSPLPNCPQQARTFCHSEGKKKKRTRIV
jgi:hypothetical protein